MANEYQIKIKPELVKVDAASYKQLAQQVGNSKAMIALAADKGTIKVIAPADDASVTEHPVAELADQLRKHDHKIKEVVTVTYMVTEEGNCCPIIIDGYFYCGC